MAKSSNQKLKLLYIIKILLTYTDETHSLTMKEIIELLYNYGIKAERKSIYDDIEALKLFGFDIIGEQKDRTYYYRVVNRDFELAELKLLVDAVQSSKFITVKKSHTLIKKIENLSSKYDASKLQREVCISERVKTINENIYYTVDIIHTAIYENVNISFQYFQWTVDKEMKKKKDGESYNVSPWALTWDDENYYLIAYDIDTEKIKHFRVDKILNICLTKQERKGKELFNEFDMALYTKKIFGMFGGEEYKVRIRFKNDLAGIVIDRFGKNISFFKNDDETFDIVVSVAVSNKFLSWIFALGEGAKIISPEFVLEKAREEIHKLNKLYFNK